MNLFKFYIIFYLRGKTTTRKKINNDKKKKKKAQTKAKQQTEQTQSQIFHFTACRSCAALKFTDIQR